jgi:probable HAF family extracellular repeat protein
MKLKVAVTSFLLLASQAGAAPNYQAIDLGSLGGGTTWATGINESGQVVGFSTLSPGGSYHAYFWQNDGLGMRDLGTLTPALSYATSQAFGINDAGRVAGGSYSGTYQAFITGPQGVSMTDVSPPNVWSPEATAINNRGQMAGIFNDRNIFPYSHAFIMNADGAGFRDLTIGGAFSAANGINDIGQVTGSAYATAQGLPMHAFITGANGYNMRDLGTLGGNVSYGHAINNLGQVAGTSSTPSGHLRAFLTDMNGNNMRDLGNLAQHDDFESWANGLNDRGQVVGWSATLKGMSAFVTDPNGTGMYDLNLLTNIPSGVVFSEANGINELGQIIVRDNVHGHAYLLTPVPEPSAATMLLAGLVMLGAVGAQRSRKLVDGYFG